MEQVVRDYYAPRMANIHEVRTDGHWSYPVHRHVGTMDLVICVSGHLKNTVNGKTVVLKPGQLFWVLDQDIHSVTGYQVHFFNIDLSPTVVELMADGMAMHDRYRDLVQGHRRPAFDLGDHQKLILTKVKRFIDKQYDEAAPIYLRNLLAEVLTVISLQKQTAEKRLIPWLEKLCKHIELHLGTTQSADLPTLCGYSASHISRTFKSAFGESPSQYINRLRIARAATRLSSSNETISQICFELGFGSLSYFYRLFQQSQGLTPLAFRKKNNPYS